MASLHLCSSIANLNQTDQHHFFTFKAGSILYRMKRSKSCCLGLGIYSFPQIHVDITGDTENGLRGSTSSRSSVQRLPLKIGIVGLGAFGQFLAKSFQRQGHNLLATSRSNYSEYCQDHGIQFFRHLNELCDAQPDILLVCNSILSTEDVVRGIPFDKLNPNTIIADVLSVKQYPKNLLLEVVPSGFGILCTHPMFGKFSGESSWEGLRFVYDKVRITENSVQAQKCEQFLDIFQDEGCKMVEMTCEDHDQYVAESQFVTHTVARILSHMSLQATPIDTKGYEILMELSKNSVSHGTDLYDGLFLYNINSAKQIKKLEKAFDVVKHTLFMKLREMYKSRLEESVVEEEEMAAEDSVSSREVNQVIQDDSVDFKNGVHNSNSQKT